MKIVIFAGGVGTRLWPLSRKASPKQFEKVIGDKSTLQLAIERLMPDFSQNDIYISTGKRYCETVKKQLPKIPKEQIIGEPEMRDVGPAVGLITSILVKKSSDEPMAIIWSDHLVKKEELFRKTLKEAESYVKKNKDKIVFISQKPRFASQNLGWIDFGNKLIEKNSIKLFKFEGFKYRPDLATADKYFKSGHHAWNLGYFVTTPKFLWSLYEKYAPDLFKKLKTIQEKIGSSNYNSVLEEIYPTLAKISFDNAILEKIDKNSAVVISEDLEWSDVGAWEALKEALQKNTDDNVTQGRVLTTDCKDSLIYNFGNQMVVTIDLDGLLVVNTHDVILVCKKESVPKIKKVVEGLSGTENEHLT